MTNETRPRKGSIECILGSVSAGKSEEAIRRARRAIIARRKVQAFKPIIDDRYAGVNHISSHDGTTIEAVPVRKAIEILALVDKDTDVIVIDEVQFLDGIVEVADQLAESGYRVICSGLDQTFAGQPFGRIGELMCIAESVTKLRAVCVICGEEASRTQRLLDGKPAPSDGPTILVGGIDPNAQAYSYEARCRSCHELPAGKPGQLDVFVGDDGARGRPITHFDLIRESAPAGTGRPLFEGEPIEDWRWAMQNGGAVDATTGEVTDWGPKGKPVWAGFSSK